MNALFQEPPGEVGTTQILSAIGQLDAKQTELFKRIDEMTDEHEETKAELSRVAKAFPGGDTDGHRRYHETVVQMLEEKRRLRVAVQEKTISGLIWAGLVGLATLMWHQIKNQFHIQP